MSTTKEAGEYLDMKRDSVAGAIRRSRISARKVDGRWSVGQDEVLRYARGRRQPGSGRNTRVDRANGGKRCSKCKEYKSIEQFNGDSDRHDGHSSRCKVCHNDMSRQRNKRPEVYKRRLEATRRWLSRRPDYIRKRYMKNRKRLHKLIKPHPGFVYIVSSGGCHKIGIAQNLAKRVERMQTSNPFNIRVKCAFWSEYTRLLERQLHELFRNKRKRGEWFMLDDQDIEQIKRMATV